MAVKAAGKEVETVTPTALAVKEMTSRDRQSEIARATDLSELRAVMGVAERSWQDIEPSFDVVDKGTFKEFPLIVGAFRFNDSKTYMTVDPETDINVPTVFVSALVAGYDPETEKFVTPWVIINDGSTGIRDQLARYAAQYDNNPLLAPPLKVDKGLRPSEYSKQIEVTENGKTTSKVVEATTWYLG